MPALSVRSYPSVELRRRGLERGPLIKEERFHRLAARELARCQAAAYRARAPKGGHQAALIATMVQERRHGTAWAACGWRRNHELEEDSFYATVT
jgi:hypothetical protein